MNWRSVLSGGVGRRAAAIYVVLVASNIGAWIWALTAFRHAPVLLGTALLAYTFGLRHAVDADHIAAIDNVTRKLMQDGQRPVGIGFFFSLGHSSIVVAASVAIAATATAFKDRMEALHGLGGIAGTLVSAVFLLAVAVMNIVVLLALRRSFLRARAGARIGDEALDALLTGGGVLARILRPLFRVITQSWHMYPLGVLFGLGFDTATEVGLLGISAAEAAHGVSIWSILVFPALFTAGMSLIDTTDGLLMLGAYGWAFVRPLRKLYYNMTITFVSVLVALLVGGIEALGLLGDRFGLQGPFWNAIGLLNDNFGMLGFVIIGIFVATWIVAMLVWRWRGYEANEAG